MPAGLGPASESARLNSVREQQLFMRLLAAKSKRTLGVYSIEDNKGLEDVLRELFGLDGDGNVED